MDIHKLTSAMSRLARNISNLQGSERQELSRACEELKNALETPFDRVGRLAFSGHQLIALRLAVDLKLFDAMNINTAQPEDSEIKTEELATKTQAEPLLLTRIMRFLAAMSIVHEVRSGVYAPTPLAADFVSNSPLSAGLIHSTHFMSVLSRLPEYFEAKGWKSPDDAFDGPFQFAVSSSEHYFDFLSSNPYYGQAFNKVMAMPFRRRGQNWFEFFPVEEKLRVSSALDPLVVDIGGGQGEDLRKFQDRFPDLPGKLILQDLAPVIMDMVKLPHEIEAQAYDFFQEQPVKHAKAYFMRTVLHDWPDKQAEEILKRVHDAMDQDSTLLINEIMLPELGVLLPSVLSDMQMMGSFASLERTELQWQILLENAGFELVQVWLPPGCDKSPDVLAGQAAVFEARQKGGKASKVII